MNNSDKVKESNGFKYEIIGSNNSVDQEVTPIKERKDSFEDHIEYCEETDEEENRIIESSQVEENKEEKNKENENQVQKNSVETDKNENEIVERKNEEEIEEEKKDLNVTKEILMSQEIFKEVKGDDEDEEDLKDQEREVVDLLANFENTVKDEQSLQETPKKKKVLKKLKKKEESFEKKEEKEEDEPKKLSVDQDDIVEIMIENYKKQERSQKSSQPSPAKPNQVLATEFKDPSPTKKRASLSKQLKTIEEKARNQVLNEKLNSKNQIFKGIYFITTQVPNVNTQITNCGGKLLEVEDLKDDNFDDECIIVISDRHRRTIKYLIGLSLSVPILSSDWIYDCLKSDKLLEPEEKHFLSAGLGIVSNTVSNNLTQDDFGLITQSQVFELKPIKLSKRILYRRKIYFELNVDNADQWLTLVKLAGATIASTVEECIYVIYIGKNDQLPKELIEQAKKYKKEVLSQEYLIQCLITNDEIKKYDCMKYKLDDIKEEEKIEKKRKHDTDEEEELKLKNEPPKKKVKSSNKTSQIRKKSLKQSPKQSPKQPEKKKKEEKIELEKKENKEIDEDKKIINFPMEDKKIINFPIEDEKEMIKMIKKLFRENKIEECKKLLDDAKSKVINLKSFIDFTEKLLE